MAMNPIQFGSEGACERALRKAPWPERKLRDVPVFVC